MKRLFIICCALTLLGGCAQFPRIQTPDAATNQTPQSNNRLRVSENNDLFGI